MGPEDHVLYGTVFGQPEVTCAAPLFGHDYVTRSSFKSVVSSVVIIFLTSVKLKKKQPLFSQYTLFVMMKFKAEVRSQKLSIMCILFGQYKCTCTLHVIKYI